MDTYLSVAQHLQDSGVVAAEQKLKHWLRFNASRKMEILLPDAIVDLPFPLFSPEEACQTALPLLKYLSEMFYRTKDLTKAALTAYLKGDLWTALDLYDEAANLGVLSAQENAAFLYEQLKAVECAEAARNASLLPWSLDAAVLIWGIDGGTGEAARLREECEWPFERLAERRWLQLARAGEAIALRKVADLVIDAQRPSAPAEKGDLHRLPRKEAFDNFTTESAVRLYAAAASEGDIQSMFTLGWLVKTGKPQG